MSSRLERTRQLTTSRLRGSIVGAGLFVFLLFLGRSHAAAEAGQVPHDTESLRVWLGEDASRLRVWEACRALGQTADHDVQRLLVEHLLLRVPPDQMEVTLEDSPELAPGVHRLLAEQLSRGTSPGVLRLSDYLAEAARSRSDRLGRRGGPWRNEELESLLTLQLVDPQRFASDERFREVVLDILPRAVGRDAGKELRDILLFTINNVPGIDFDASETIETAWEVVARPSRLREGEYESLHVSFPDGGVDPILASVYSFPSSTVEGIEASRLLASVREAAPGRTLVVLVDLPLRVELQSVADRLNVHLIETHGRSYSAWPRDPFSLVRAGDGGAVVLSRPNEQRGRREDNFLGRELVQGLPDSLDRAWGRIRWTRSPLPFHNGQVLLTRKRAWVSIHSLEPHILRILGLERVPAEDFGNASAWLDYVQGARRAARELEAFYGREVAFVHDLFESENPRELAGATSALGGGAGFDLDSLVTFLESDSGSLRALVGDLDEGRLLLSRASEAELGRFGQAFGLELEGETLRRRLEAAQDFERARRLDAFLDLMSRNLQGKGIAGSRLPIFFVPVELLRNRAEFHHEDFLITWNNVVVERARDTPRAEGFRQELSSGDEKARLVFRENGYELDLLPPLVRSIVLVGGYRCASQHLRALTESRERPRPEGW